MDTEPILIFAYSDRAEKWAFQRAEPDPVELDAPSVLTLNTWFESPHRAMRYAALVYALERSRADIMCLQEVTKDLLSRLETAPWVREECVMVTSPSVYTAYGVMILSRLPIRRAWELPFSSTMNRGLLGIELARAGEAMVVASSHFESTRSLAATRVHQLHDAFSMLSRFPAAILTGDFNFDPRAVEQAAIDPLYLDVWTAVHRDEPGYTADTERNAMRRLHHETAKQARYDRILARVPGYVPEVAELFGAEPIGENVFLSDHFGVFASFRRRRP